MLNSVVLIGRLTKDPELRYTPSGKAVATLRLAVDRGTVNQQGERETDFIDIVVWEKQAETVANYLQKGRLVAVQGRLQIRQYTTQDGQKREKAEVVASHGPVPGQRPRPLRRRGRLLRAPPGGRHGQRTDPGRR